MSEPRAWPAGRPEVLHHIANSLNARLIMLFGFELSFGEWCTVIGAVVVGLSYAARLLWCVSITHQRVLRIEPMEQAHQQLEKRVGANEQTIAKHGVQLEHFENRKASPA